MAKVMKTKLSIPEFGYKTENSFNAEAFNPFIYRKTKVSALSPRNTMESLDCEEFPSSFKKHYPPRFGSSIQEKSYIKTFPKVHNRESIIIESPISAKSFFFTSPKAFAHRERRHFTQEKSLEASSPARRLLSPGLGQRESSMDEIFGRRKTNPLEIKKSELQSIGSNTGTRRKSPEYTANFFANHTRESTRNSIRIIPEPRTSLIKSRESLTLDASPVNSLKQKVNDDEKSQGTPKVKSFQSMNSFVTWTKPAKKLYEVEFRPLRTSVGSRRGFRIKSGSNGISQMSSN